MIHSKSGLSKGREFESRRDHNVLFASSNTCPAATLGVALLFATSNITSRSLDHTLAEASMCFVHEDVASRTKSHR